jgi:hypothetical protein
MNNGCRFSEKIMREQHDPSRIARSGGDNNQAIKSPGR